MENNHFDLNAKRRMLYKRKKIRRLLKLFLTSFFSLMIVLGIASSYIKNNTNITTLKKQKINLCIPDSDKRLFPPLSFPCHPTVLVG